jgi:hypothetical protein
VLRLGIGVTQDVQVPFAPGGVGDRGLADLLEIFALGRDGNREPVETFGGLDRVSIPPIPAGELHVVEENELVDPVDEIEVALPGNVARLNDRDSLQGCLTFRSRVVRRS